MKTVLNGFELSRRRVLQGAGGLAGAAALGMPNLALAEDKGTIIVGTWGGDYARLLHKNIEVPFLIDKGWKVVQDQAGDPQRRAKMMAERRLPRGTSDVQGLSASNIYQMGAAGVCEPIDYSQIPLAPHLLDSMKYEFGVGQIYSGMVPVYNPDVVPDAEAPKSYKEAFDPKWGAKMGIIDIQYQYTMVAAALAAGGTVTDIEPGKEVLLAARKAGCRIYPTNEAFAQGLKAEEFGVGIMWKARTVQWQNAGINVKSNAPTEGTLPYVSGFSIPKNAPNKEGAYAYLNAMLEPAAQENFAVDMGYNPTIDNADIPAELNARIGFTPAEIAALAPLNYGFLTDHDAEMKEWWDKEFKG